MRNTLLIVLTLCTFTTAKAQTTDIIDSLFQTPQVQFEFIADNLDLSDISSGLLADKAWQLSTLDNYSGVSVADSNKANAFEFCKLYASLSGMPIDSTYKLPNPDTYTQVTKLASSNQVFMGGIHYEYSELKPFAIDSNLILSDGSQLFDVADRAESPYLAKEVFLISPLKTETEQLTNTFIFRSDLFYTNTEKTINTIRVDFGDGNGFESIQLDSMCFIDYPDTGLKTIETHIKYLDGTNYKSHAVLKVNSKIGSLRYDDTAITPPIFTATKGYTFMNEDGEIVTEYAKASITIQLACGHENLQKPLIWVEGFNPPLLEDLEPGSNLDYEDMEYILYHVKGEVDGQRLLLHLEQEGYDLIYVDYEDGGDWLQKNAYVVQDIIRWVNEEKAKNGSTEQNIVLGESMGGVVAKFALRDMELSGEDHDTKTYISLDSPHQGANIPLSAQYAAKQLPNIRIFGLKLWRYMGLFGETDIRAGEDLLNTRAARQMLIYQAPDNFHNQTATSLTSSYHASFYSLYQSMGALENCEMLMSSNGTTTGFAGSQPFAPLTELIKIDFGPSDAMKYILEQINIEWGGVFESSAKATIVAPIIALAWVSTLTTRGKVNFRLNALPNYSGDNERIYKGHFAGFIGGLPISFSHKTVKVKHVRPLDSAPGGFYDTYISLPTTDIPPFTDYAIANGNLAVRSNTFNYIPTYSSLDLPVGYKDDPYAVIGDLDASNSLSTAYRTVGHNGVYGYRDFFNNDIDLKNSLHINFHNRNARWFLFHLVGNNNINSNFTLSSGSFNFGEAQMGPPDNFETISHRRTTSRIDHLERIRGTGQVFVNTSNRIGFIGVDGGSYTVLGNASNPTNFVVNIKPECGFETKTLLVDDGGLLYVGYGEYQTGDLHVHAGVTLTIGDRGKLYIDENSKLIVHPGARVIIENGGRIVNHGKIELLGIAGSVFETVNGYLEYQKGAIIIMPKTEAEIHFNGGILHIGNEATFTFIHDGYSESGQLRFSKSGLSITGASNAVFNIDGKGDTDVILILEKDADFWTAEINLVKIRNGKTLLADNSRLVSIPRFYTKKVHYDGVEGNRHLVLFQSSLINDCLFNNTGIDAPLYIKNKGVLKVYNSDFYDYSGSEIIKVTGKGYIINGSTFTSDVDNMIYSSGMTQTATIVSSTFNGNQVASYASSGVLDYSENNLIIGHSNFNENNLAVEKSNGQLKLRCNTFEDFKLGGVYASNNCWLEMTTASNAGYNHFEKYNAGEGRNIWLNNATFMQLDEGSNIFDESGFLPIIEGSLQVGEPGLAMSLYARKNQWSTVLPSYIPPTSKFDITSSIGGGAITLVADDVESTICGTYDVYIAGPIGYSDYTEVVHISTPHFTDEELRDAINHTMKQTELLDTSKNDLFALELFEEILTYNYQDTVDIEERKRLLNYAYHAMKYTWQHAISSGKIEIDSNLVSFDIPTLRYVNVLNTLSTPAVDSANYSTFFRYELDKAHVYHTIGNNAVGLSILKNMETCGVDLKEQVQVNFWKKQFETEKAIINYGLEGYLIDTTWIDTSKYKSPVNQLFGNFSSTIISPVYAQLSNCLSAPSTPNFIEDNTVPFSIFPNPSNGVFNVIYFVPNASVGELVFYSVLGKRIAIYTCKEGEQTLSIDLSEMERGVYLYSFLVDGIENSTGKVIIR